MMNAKTLSTPHRMIGLSVVCICSVGLCAPSIYAQRPSIADLQTQIADQAAEIATLQANSVLALDGFVALDDSDPTKPAVRVAGANLQIVNGMGQTDSINGLGNLVVGYDETRQPEDETDPVCSDGMFADEPSCLGGGEVWSLNHKSGSHTVVIGPEHNYSQNGGLVAGYQNTINGVYASVTGGGQNVASGEASSVSGGAQNRAGGLSASVSGGNGNAALSRWSSASGGFLNIATGDAASVSGGDHNAASAPGSSVSGGQGNSASASLSSVSGGQNNTADGDWSSVSGGSNRTAVGTRDWVAGGLFQDN